MFDNIGSKVKGLAVFVCVLGILASVITGIALFAQSNRYVDYTLPGILTIVLGSLFSWIGSWVMYAVGEAAEKADENAYMLAELQKQLRGENGETHGSQERTSGYAPNFGKNTPSYVTSGPVRNVQLTPDSEKIVCPICGAKNKKTNEKCFACGVDLQ